MDINKVIKSAQDKCKIEFPLKSWINIEGLSEEEYYVKVSDYLVNNKEPMNVVIGSERMYWLFMNWLNDYEISPKPIIGKTYLKGKDND